MRELFILVAHLLTMLAKLMRPGGVRAVAAESLMLKHQMLILKRYLILYVAALPAHVCVNEVWNG